MLKFVDITEKDLETHKLIMYFWELKNACSGNSSEKTKGAFNERSDSDEVRSHS